MEELQKGLDLIQQRDALKDRIKMLETALSAILLQTVTCRAPVCSPADMENARAMLKEVGVDPQSFAYTCLRETMTSIADAASGGRGNQVLETGVHVGVANNQVDTFETALRIAAGELSTHEPHTSKHPEQVYWELISQARDQKALIDACLKD